MTAKFRTDRPLVHTALTDAPFIQDCSASRLVKLPAWKRGDLSDRLMNHMHAESIYERQVGDVLQVVERVMLRDRPTQDCRPFYRLVEVKNGKARAIHTAELRAAWTQREVRAAADRRARRLVRAQMDKS